MVITPVGLLCFLAALLVIARPMNLGLVVLAAFLPLQTAAAINLPAIGGASIGCAHVLAGALFGALLLRPRMAMAMARGVYQRPATLFLFLFVMYAVFSAFYLPRLFEGEILVFSLSRALELGEILSLSLLRPTSGNITQSAYIVGDLMLFMALVMILVRVGVHRAGSRIMNTVIVVFIGFMLVSATPPNPVSNAILDFIRTANYSIHTTHEVAGFRRIIGSYAEAAAFGGAGVALFAYSFARFLQTRALGYGVASIILLTGSLLSLSTTAFATLLVLIMLWSLQTAVTMILRGLSREDLTALFASAMTSAVVIALLFIEPVQEIGINVVDQLFGDKLVSDSGIERSSWNMQGLSNFTDSWGLGVGLGSARTSSFLTALLSNVGLIGSLLFLMFLVATFTPLRPGARLAEAGDLERVQRRRMFFASRSGAVSLLVSGIISGTLIDKGLLFYTFAAIAAASMARELAPSRRLARDRLTTLPAGRIGRQEKAPRGLASPARG